MKYLIVDNQTYIPESSIKFAIKSRNTVKVVYQDGMAIIPILEWLEFLADDYEE